MAAKKSPAEVWVQPRPSVQQQILPQPRQQILSSSQQLHRTAPHRHRAQARRVEQPQLHVSNGNCVNLQRVTLSQTSHPQGPTLCHPICHPREATSLAWVPSLAEPRGQALASSHSAAVAPSLLAGPVPALRRLPVSGAACPGQQSSPLPGSFSLGPHAGSITREITPSTDRGHSHLSACHTRPDKMAGLLPPSPGASRQPGNPAGHRAPSPRASSGPASRFQLRVAQETGNDGRKA